MIVFKIDGTLLSDGCQSQTKIVWGSLFCFWLSWRRSILFILSTSCRKQVWETSLRYQASARQLWTRKTLPHREQKRRLRSLHSPIWNFLCGGKRSARRKVDLSPANTPSHRHQYKDQTLRKGNVHITQTDTLIPFTTSPLQHPSSVTPLPSWRQIKSWRQI